MTALVLGLIGWLVVSAAAGVVWRLRERAAPPRRLTRTGAGVTALSLIIAAQLGLAIIASNAPVATGAVAWSGIGCAAISAIVAGGAVATIVLLYGPWYLLLVPALALVCWSRVVVEDHTVAQVLVGAVLGPVVGGVVFLALR